MHDRIYTHLHLHFISSFEQEGKGRVKTGHGRVWGLYIHRTGVIRAEAAKLRCDRVDFGPTVLYIEGLLSRNIV